MTAICRDLHWACMSLASVQPAMNGGGVPRALALLPKYQLPRESRKWCLILFSCVPTRFQCTALNHGYTHTTLVKTLAHKTK